MSLISALFGNKQKGHQLVYHMDGDNHVRSPRVAYQKTCNASRYMLLVALSLPRFVLLATMEEQHADVLAKGFAASVNWLNVLMRETMQLPMTRVGTTTIPPSLSDASIQEYRLFLLRIVYRVDRYDVPRSVVLSRDQSGIHLFPRRGIRRAPRGSQIVDGIGGNDKRMVTMDYAISASHGACPASDFRGTDREISAVPFERVSSQRLAAAVFAQSLEFSSLALQYVDVMQQHLTKIGPSLYHSCTHLCMHLSPWTSTLDQQCCYSHA